MRAYALLAHILNALVFDQPAQSMKCSSRLESAYTLLVLALEEQSNMRLRRI